MVQCSEDQTSVSPAEVSKRFCEIFSRGERTLNPVGKNWVSAIRKCLHLSMITLQRPYLKLSCDEARRVVASAHVHCYASPSPDSPSLCDLGFENWLKVAVTVNRSLKGIGWMGGIFPNEADVSQAASSLIESCNWEIPKGNVLRFVLKKRAFDRVKAQVQSQIEDVQAMVADRIRDELASRFNVPDWLVLPFRIARNIQKRSTDDVTVVTLYVKIMNAQAYSLMDTSDSLNVNATVAYNYIVEQMQIGYLMKPVGEYDITDYNMCDGVACNAPIRVVQHVDSDSLAAGQIVLIVLVCVLLTIVLGVGLNYCLVKPRSLYKQKYSRI